MELVTEEILKKVLIMSGETEDLESIICKEVESQGSFGENFCSNTVRLHLKLKLTSGKVFSKTLFLKIFLKDLEPEAKSEMKKYFANEAVMYNDILIHLGNLAEEHNLTEARIWPNCFFADTDLVVFDDLKEEGFVVAPRYKGLTIEESLQVIKYMGRLHALSVVAERRKLIDPQLIRKTYTWVQFDNFTSKFVKKGIQTAGDTIMQWGPEWEEVGQKIKEYSHKVSQELNNLFHQEVKLKVVNHGDAWINNFMVKYNQNKQLESLRFVDFQNATYNSVGWDLTYFLYSSIQGDLMRTNYDKLLTSYRDEFVNTMLHLGEDQSLVPTIDEIKVDIKRLHPFCLVTACTVQAVVFNNNNKLMQVDDLIVDEKLRAVYMGETWKLSIKHHIQYFQKHNLL